MADSLHELSFDPLDIIARRLEKIEDFTSFRAVCTSWREVATKDNFTGICLWQNLPYLMLPVKDEDDDEREFYSLLKKKVVVKISLPEAKGKRCVESQGWFLTTGEGGDMTLLNPFSPGYQIELPHKTTLPDYQWNEIEPDKFLPKMALSSEPSEFTVVVIYGCCRLLGFWNFGDKAWRTIEEVKFVEDITCHNGQFFAIDSACNVWCCNVSGPNLIEAEFITRIPCDKNQLYIAGSSEKLLVVAWPEVKWFPQRGSLDYWTLKAHKFEIFEIDIARKSFKKIKSLGGNAVFIGHSSSVLVEASKFSGIKANHVYYAGKGLWRRDGFNFACIHNWEDGSVESLDDSSSGLVDPFIPSIWVTPNF